MVLAVQDTTSLNYDPAGDRGAGADWHRVRWRSGLLVHDTMAYTPEGVALGLIDVQVLGARCPRSFGKRASALERPLRKESDKWLHSVQAGAACSALHPTRPWSAWAIARPISIELFDRARTVSHAPKLLIRAEQNRALSQEQDKLWEHMERRPIAGYQQLQLPRRGSRAARVATMAISYARVQLQPPKRLAEAQAGRDVGGICPRDRCPGQRQRLEWMLLTTCEVDTLAAAIEKLAWYTQRWGIEVYHRTLKSGCQIESRQLGNRADRIEACLAIDMVVAWRIEHIKKLSRESPQAPCSVAFDEPEWQALFILKIPPPAAAVDATQHVSNDAVDR